MKTLAMAAALLLASAPLAHAVTWTPVEQIGPWRVSSTKDMMTDKLSCVAYYGDTNRVQMTVGSLAISEAGNGGVSAYTMRIDDNPPQEMELANDIEKQISAVVLQGDKFAPISTAHRVRISVLTVLNSQDDRDIDLSARPQVMQVLLGPKCN